MTWAAKMMERLGTKRPPVYDPQTAALDATIHDLRNVSSELRWTNAALGQRVASLKKEPDDRPA